VTFVHISALGHTVLDCAATVSLEPISDVPGFRTIESLSVFDLAMARKLVLYRCTRTANPNTGDKFLLCLLVGERFKSNVRIVGNVVADVVDRVKRHKLATKLALLDAIFFVKVAVNYQLVSFSCERCANKTLTKEDVIETGAAACWLLFWGLLLLF
jgi:hypothetical protein